MAKDAKTRAKARALYESGKSFAQIADVLPAGVRTLKGWCKSEGWIKGESAPELHRIEQEKLEAEAEKAGIDRAKILNELALVGLADIKDLITVDKDGNVQARDLDSLGAASRTIKSIKQKKTSRKEHGAEGATIEEVTLEYVTHDKIGALVEAGNILGIKKLQVDPSDEFRAFFGSLKGGTK